jgi:hypothetical protein
MWPNFAIILWPDSVGMRGKSISAPVDEEVFLRTARLPRDKARLPRDKERRRHGGTKTAGADILPRTAITPAWYPPPVT